MLLRDGPEEARARPALRASLDGRPCHSHRPGSDRPAASCRTVSAGDVCSVSPRINEWLETCVVCVHCGLFLHSPAGGRAPGLRPAGMAQGLGEVPGAASTGVAPGCRVRGLHVHAPPRAHGVPWRRRRWASRTPHAGRVHAPRGLGDAQEARAWAPALSRGLVCLPRPPRPAPLSRAGPCPSLPTSPSRDSHVTLGPRCRPLLIPSPGATACRAQLLGQWLAAHMDMAAEGHFIWHRTPASIGAHVQQQSILPLGAWSTGDPAARRSGRGVRGRTPQRADGVPCGGQLTRGAAPKVLQLPRGRKQQAFPPQQEPEHHAGVGGCAVAGSPPWVVGSLGAGSAVGHSRLVVAGGDGSGTCFGGC